MAERKYTAVGLRKAVDRYFRSISRTVPVMDRVDSGQRDDKGHVIWEQVPAKNDLGEVVKVTEYLVPPTVGDLADFLGIHRSTWANYCDPEKHPEFFDTTTRARGRMRAYLERELLTRPGKDVRGIMFQLEWNYGSQDEERTGQSGSVEDYLRRIGGETEF